jgi:hypothetical protein
MTQVRFLMLLLADCGDPRWTLAAEPIANALAPPERAIALPNSGGVNRDKSRANCQLAEEGDPATCDLERLEGWLPWDGRGLICR